MHRLAMADLEAWRVSDDHKPLVLRGARQVGKSYLARKLGTKFENLAEVDFELRPELGSLFDKALDPDVIIKKLSVALNCQIVSGKTLLFLDEIQICPRALTALRYFYEKMPGLHVIAAGSLIDFALENIGIPVGRVTNLYLYPISFLEFLLATENERLVSYVDEHSLEEPLEEPFHNKLTALLGEYLAVGGMPEAVSKWLDAGDMGAVGRILGDLADTYRQDFSKYAGRGQIKYVEKVFAAVPRLVGKKFLFTSVDPSLRARELRPALEMLARAGVVHIVTHTSANGIPLGAEVNPLLFKTIFLDVALAQALLGLDTRNWILNPKGELSNRGAMAESFVGQEIMAYSSSRKRAELFYWAREKKGSQAEVDYVFAQGGEVVPVEVKAGKSGTLKSLKYFLSAKDGSNTGFHFSLRNFAHSRNIRSIPLYAVWRVARSL